MAEELGLSVLYEVHNEDELGQALELSMSLVGINNRDLKTLQVDINTTRGLLPKIPEGVTIVSESGISTPEDVRTMNDLGVDALLVGTSLISSEDIAGRIRDLFSEIWYN